MMAWTDGACGAGVERNCPETASQQGEWGIHLAIKGSVPKLLSNQMEGCAVGIHTGGVIEGQ